MTRLDRDRFDSIPPPPLAGDSFSDGYFRGLAQRELRIQCCADCASLQHPPRPICRRCTSLSLTFRRLSGRGVLIDASDVFETHDPFADIELTFRRAVIQLDEQEGLQLLAKLVVAERSRVHIGAAVAADYLPCSSGEWALVFRLTSDAVARQIL